MKKILTTTLMSLCTLALIAMLLVALFMLYVYTDSTTKVLAVSEVGDLVAFCIVDALYLVYLVPRTLREVQLTFKLG